MRRASACRQRGEALAADRSAARVAGDHIGEFCRQRRLDVALGAPSAFTGGGAIRRAASSKAPKQVRLDAASARRSARWRARRPEREEGDDQQRRAQVDRLRRASSLRFSLRFAKSRGARVRCRPQRRLSHGGRRASRKSPPGDRRPGPRGCCGRQRLDRRAGRAELAEAVEHAQAAADSPERRWLWLRGGFANQAGAIDDLSQHVDEKSRSGRFDQLVSAATWNRISRPARAVRP